MGIEKNKKGDCCCQLMNRFVDDPRVGIDYNKKLREYSIDLKLTRAVQQDIFHCPFCGFKLPKGLRQEYCNIVKNKFSIDCIFNDEETKKLPEEFMSDQWWKKRGL